MSAYRLGDLLGKLVIKKRRSLGVFPVCS